MDAVADADAGYAFGKGVYLASESCMSWNFSNHYNSGGTALLLACEAHIGDPIYKVDGHDGNAPVNSKKHGAIATLMECWKDHEWDDAGKLIDPSLAGIKMPARSATREVGRRVGFNNDEVSGGFWALVAVLIDVSLSSTTRRRSRCGIFSGLICLRMRGINTV